MSTPIRRFGQIAMFALAGLIGNGLTGQEQDVKFPEVADSKLVPLPIESTVQLSPGNSCIQFIGTHVGDEPKPRLGGFSKFSGTLDVDTQRKIPTSLKLEIDVASVWTEFDKLTAHLQNPDFFEVEKYPTAKFESSEIALKSDGRCEIKGELTLHGTAGPFSFPAQLKMDDSGMLLMAEFQLDRTKFGMTKMTQGVEKLVSVQLIVGKKTESR